MLIAWGLLRVLLQFLPRQGIAYEVEISLDRPVLLFSLAVSALASLVFGLMPALHGARRDLVGGLKQGGRGIAAGFRQRGLRGGLVIGEVALSLVLLIAATLLIRSFVRMTRVDIGMDATNVLRFVVLFASNDPRTPSQQQQAVSRALERVAALPGVVAAAEATGLPTDGFRSDVEVPGRPRAERRRLRYQLCSQGYLRTFGVRLLRGRDFTEDDIGGARHVTIVNETLAATHFPGEDPIGRTIVVAGLRTVSDPVAEPVFEIVGVTRDARNGGLRGDPRARAAFLPSTISGFGRRLIAAKTAADARLQIEPVRRAVWSLDPGLALTQPQPLDEVLRERYYAQPRFSLIVLVAFAAIGLLLVAVGVYGVMAYTVARQRQEIALRMALGASRGAVHALVLGTGGRLLAAGIAIGLLLGLAASRLIASQLWSTSPYDPLALVLAVAVILAIGLVACYVPAARAVRIDPGRGAAARLSRGWSSASVTFRYSFRNELIEVSAQPVCSRARSSSALEMRVPGKRWRPASREASSRPACRARCRARS